MILFSDFDDVTHPQPCFHENVFCRLHLIESVLREREPRATVTILALSSGASGREGIGAECRGVWFCSGERFRFPRYSGKTRSWPTVTVDL